MRAPCQGAGSRSGHGSDELSHVSLPLALTALLDADVTALRDVLADPAVRLITLVGPGGVGKTVWRWRHAIADESACRVSSGWRSSELSVRRAGDCRGSRRGGRYVGRPAEARAARMRGSADVAVARQLRARPGQGVAGRESPVVRRYAPSAGYQPRPPPCARRAGIRGAATRVGCERGREVARRPRACSRRAAIRGTGSGHLISSHGVERTHGDAICRRLDALPLALELAARWIVLPAEDLLRRLIHDGLLSTAGPAISPNGNRRSMRLSPGAINSWPRTSSVCSAGSAYSRDAFR